MFKFISSCQNERDISFENYLKSSVVSVVSVVSGQKIAVSSTTDEKISVVELKDSVVEARPNSIEAELLQAEAQTKAKEEHFRKVAEEHTGPKLDPPKRVGTKKILSYSDMAGFVPYDISSSETEKICRSFRGQLMKGMAPRIDFLVKETELPKESIEGYLNSAPWIRKDDSSPAGIVVYLPVEALA